MSAMPHESHAAAYTIACAICGSELGVQGRDWALEHHDDGSHTAWPPDPNDLQPEAYGREPVGSEGGVA